MHQESQGVESFEKMAALEESKKDKKTAPIRSTQSRSNMANLTQKHKRLTEAASAGCLLKAPSHVIGGNSSAIPYRVSRVAQPTQHKNFAVIAENQLTDEDDLDDSWF